MLQIGDIVTLNSGGLEMTIIACDGKTATVKYETEDEFPVACLKRVFGQDQEFMGRQGLTGEATAQRGEVASQAWHRVVTEILCAQFHFGLSVCSVKVVRHKMAEYFARDCGKAADGLRGLT